MANRAYLLAVDDRTTTWSGAPEREIIAEGIDEVPVFWASLFVAADRQLDQYEGDAGELLIPNWCVSSHTARERLERVREPIASLLDERSREIWELWVCHLMAEGAAYFKTNAAEVWELDPDGYEAYWRTLLRPFAAPSAAHLQAAVQANGLRLIGGVIQWDDEEETICKLAGADHIRDVPWLD
ncbi:MAG TPA: hypothetical protein VK689_17510 [Armatimonadota bacterium]|nr:hypothetical protein [Armatimonadota bacterium]